MKYDSFKKSSHNKIFENLITKKSLNFENKNDQLKLAEEIFLGLYTYRESHANLIDKNPEEIVSCDSLLEVSLTASTKDLDIPRLKSILPHPAYID